MAESIDDRLITTFGRLVEAYSRMERRLGPAMETATGLPHAWFEVLIRLARSEEGQLTMGALADEVALTTGGITRLVDRMAKADYVERRPCASDRRVSYAAITGEGRAILDRAAVAHAHNLRELFTDFTERDLDSLDGLLDLIRDTARRPG